MPYCSVNNCHNQTGKNKMLEGVVMHTFPRKLHRIKQWLRCIGRHRIRQDVEDLDAVAQLILHGGNNSSFRICSNHFSPDCYVSTKEKRRSLRHDAMPTVFTADNEKSNWSNFPTEMMVQHNTVSMVHASTSTDCHENMEDKGVQWPEFEFNEGGEPWKIQHDHVYHTPTPSTPSSRKGSSKLKIVCMDLGPLDDEPVSSKFDSGYKSYTSEHEEDREGFDSSFKNGHEKTSGQGFYDPPYKLQHPFSKCQHYPSRIEKDGSHMTDIILKLTLEIMYLLTEEDFTVLMKSGERLTPNLLPRFSRSLSRNHDKEILEVTNKIIELLTGEVPIRCQDVTVYLSMEEWEYIEGHKDLYEEVMIEKHKPFISFGKRGNPDADVSEGSHFSEYALERYRARSSCSFPDDGNCTIFIKEQALDEEDIEVMVVEEPEIEYMASPIDKNLHTHHHKYSDDTDDPSCISPDVMDSDSDTSNKCSHFRKRYSHRLWCQRRDKINKPMGENAEGSNVEFSATGYGSGDSSDSDQTGDRASKANSKTRLGSPEGSLKGDPSQYLSPDTLPIIKEEPSSSDDEHFETMAVKLKEDHSLLEVNAYSAEKPTHMETMSIINADGTVTYIKRESPLEGDDEYSDVGTITDPRKCMTRPLKKVSDSSSQRCPGGAKWLSDLPESQDHTGWSKKYQRAAGNPFTCTVCGKSFACNSALETHGRIHTGEKPFSCSKCGKCFMRIAGLCAHEKVHTREKIFQCSECRRCFSSKTHFVRHQVIHTTKFEASNSDFEKGVDSGPDFVNRVKFKAHEEPYPYLERTLPVDTPFLCLECGKCFELSSSLLLHQKTHREKQQLPRPYCRKCFPSRSHLERHERIHTGEKPFSCSYCDKKFANRSSVAVHQRLHTGEKPYSCSVCGRCFTDLSGLVVHKRKHDRVMETS